MRGCIGHDTSRRYCMTHMFGESDFAAPHLPRASIGPGEQKFISDPYPASKAKLLPVPVIVRVVVAPVLVF
jgi:hypothetical protein